MDVGRMVGAVTRVVGTREMDGRPARVVVAQRRYAGTIDEVWDALTNPERIPRWFLPVSGDLRLGGRYQLKGNAGGEVTAAIRRGSSPSPGKVGGSVSWLTVHARPGRRRDRFRARARRARRRRVVGPVRSGRRRRRLGHGPDGAGRAPHRAPAVIRRRRRSVGRVRRRQGLRARAAATSWADASIAAGTPADAARAAAARTTAFYTGAARRRPDSRGPRMHAFDVLRDPVRRRILELLADGEAPSGRRRRGDPARVRHHPAGGVAAPEGAARQRLRSVRADGARRSTPWKATALASSMSWLAASAGCGYRGSRRWPPRWRGAGASAVAPSVTAPRGATPQRVTRSVAR